MIIYFVFLSHNVKAVKAQNSMELKGGILNTPPSPFFSFKMLTAANQKFKNFLLEKTRE